YLVRARDLAGDWSFVHLNLGLTCKALGRRKEAEDCFRRAAHLDPTYSDAWGELAGLYLAQKRHGKAADALVRLVALRPTEGSLILSLAGSALRSGKPAIAAEAFHKVIRHDPAGSAALCCMLLFAIASFDFPAVIRCRRR